MMWALRTTVACEVRIGLHRDDGFEDDDDGDGDDGDDGGDDDHHDGVEAVVAVAAAAVVDDDFVVGCRLWAVGCGFLVLGYWFFVVIVVGCWFVGC